MNFHFFWELMANKKHLNVILQGHFFEEPNIDLAGGGLQNRAVVLELHSRSIQIF